MKKELKNKLTAGLTQIDPAFANASDKLEVFFDELMLFNPSLKLVGDSEEEIITRHILDCAAPVNIIKQQINGAALRFADLGTGAGFPGLVLATLMENAQFSLVDRMARRTGFLFNTVTRMKLGNRVVVKTEELENLHETFDIVTFRAFRKLEDIAKNLALITEPGSLVFIYKSTKEDIESEVSSLEKAVPGVFSAAVQDYTVPMLEAKRSLLILKHN